MDNQKQAVAQAVKEANNVLVTVSANPSVDQLAACIGLTLALNKMGKHATAVFSGAVPSTIEFLQPEKTLEKNTDSLRDFIIALDKSKADKLRYKVEDRVVKIFITPYKTSISDKDLEFSQGDFNVDVVVALGVHAQQDLDQAITSHGRILHDAKVITVNTKPGGELGVINWLMPVASSLSELVTSLVQELDKKMIDSQIATALLTGIVAETERFSNARTAPQTMSVAAELMGAGANQQLVASKLEEGTLAPAAPAPIASHDGHEEPVDVPQKNDDGMLEIAHEAGDKPAEIENEGDHPTPSHDEPQHGDHTDAGGLFDHQNGDTPNEPASFGQPESESESERTPSPDAEPKTTDGSPEPVDIFDDAHLKAPDIPAPAGDHDYGYSKPSGQDDFLGEGPRHADSEVPPATIISTPAPWVEPAGPVVTHHDEPQLPPLPEAELPTPAEDAPQIHIDEHGRLSPLGDAADESAAEAMLPKEKHEELHKSDRPYLAGPNPHPEDNGILGLAPNTPPAAGVGDPLTLPDLNMPLLDRQPLQHVDHPHTDHPGDLGKIMPPAEVVTPTMSATGHAVERDGAVVNGRFVDDSAASASVTSPASEETPDDTTLSQLEKDVNSPHLATLTPYETLASDPASHDTPSPDVVPAGPAAHEETATPAFAPVPPEPVTPSAIPEPAFTVPDAVVPAAPKPPESEPPAAASDDHKDEQLPESPTVEDARSAVERAINAMAAGNNAPLEPKVALNSTPLGKPLHEDNPIKGATGIVLVPPDAPEPADAMPGSPPPVPPPFPG
jgi:hypothetical protein